MANKQKKQGPNDPSFEQLRGFFMERCDKLGLFIHSPAFKFTPDDAFKIYLECWRKKLIREHTIVRSTYYKWVTRGWITEEFKKDFLEYVFGNRA